MGSSAAWTRSPRSARRGRRLRESRIAPSSGATRCRTRSPKRPSFRGLRSWRPRLRWVLVPLAVMIVAESWFVGPVVPVPVPVQLYLPDDAVVLDLPITAAFNADAQYRAVMGNYRVVNGYSGYSPPDYLELVAAINEQRSPVFTPFRRRADLYVIVPVDDVAPSVVPWLDMQPGVE